jgi:hypothetical protein
MTRWRRFFLADVNLKGCRLYTAPVNMRTARALGLSIPPMLLARANEVIE